MNENKNEINVLDELNKGACMGILDKVKDKALKKELNIQYKKYNDDKPHETTAMNKAMTWSGIEMKTTTDHTTSKIAELLLQGTNMGMFEGRRLLNHKNTNDEVHSLVQKYVDMQEQTGEKLKQFL